MSTKYQNITYSNNRDMVDFCKFITRRSLMTSWIDLKRNYNSRPFLGISTLERNIWRTASLITVIHISFFSIFKALSYESNLYSLCSCLLNFDLCSEVCVIVLVYLTISLENLFFSSEKASKCMRFHSNNLLTTEMYGEATWICYLMST